MSGDNGYSSGFLAPWDPANYSDPARYAGMAARRDSDARLAATKPPDVYGGTVDLPDGVTAFLAAAALVLLMLVLPSGSGRSGREGAEASEAAVDPAEMRRLELLEKRRAIAEKETSAALKAALRNSGDSGTAEAIVDFINRSPCHRNVAGGHFENRTSVLHCRRGGSPIDSYIGFSHFELDSAQALPFRGVETQVETETSVFPFNDHNLASLHEGISALDSDDRKFFASGVARVRAQGLGRYLRRPECAVVRNETWASATFAQGEVTGVAHARVESPPRLGCLKGGRFRYVL